MAESDKHPTLRNGKICYLEMPASDIKTSANFYKEVFRWNTRTRGDGAIAFDDTVGEVSGTWVLGRKPMIEVGLLVYIMVIASPRPLMRSLQMAERSSIR